MFLQIVRSRSFWTGVLRFGFIFIVVLSLIQFFFEYQGFHFGQFYSDKLANGQWPRYVISRLVGGFIYGFIMSYITQRRKVLTHQDTP